jgi:hypothetical protein
MILEAGELRKIGNDIGALATSSLQHFLKIQGHQYTGALAASIGFDVSIEETGMRISFYAAEYGVFVNSGVPAARIPFGGGRSKGGTSKYIQRLYKYAKGKLGVGSDKEALKVAFMIANKHKKEGSPTQNSKKYSQNGMRTDFIGNALDFIEEELALLISDFTFLFIDIIFKDL